MQNSRVIESGIDFGKVRILSNDNYKICLSKNYNYIFNKKDGSFARWGVTKDDDPNYAPSPEILDCEVSTSCKGIPGKNGITSPCSFCYKANGPHGRNMSLDTFKKVLDAFPISLTQVAFGADSEAKSNPDLWGMMDYSREKGVIPNITVANVDDETADKLVSHCGAVAVSRYDNKDVCYDSVKRLTDRGLKQTNIHCMVSRETFDNCMETLHDRLTDERLAEMNAIVFLSLKKKGRGEKFHTVSKEKFKELVDFAFENGISIGFDSCSAPKFLSSIEGHEKYDQYEQMVEPCESLLFSFYVNVDGKYTPCSFCEGGLEDFGDGIDITNCKNFLDEVWYSEPVKKFRNNLLNKRRQGDLTCPVFEV